MLIAKLLLTRDIKEEIMENLEWEKHVLRIAYNLYKQTINKKSKFRKAPANTAEDYNCRGREYYNKWDYDNAITNFTEAIRLNPQKAEYRNNRGLTYALKGDHSRAIVDFTDAIRLKPRIADFHNNMGLVYRDKGDYDNAIACFSEAIGFIRPDVRFLVNRSDTYVIMGDYNKAINDLAKVIQRNPQEAISYKRRGLVYCYKGDYGKAIIDFSDAILYKPCEAEYYSLRGSAYASQNDYDKAVDDLIEAIRLDPSDTSNLFWRGDIYLDKGDCENALADFESLLQVTKNDNELVKLVQLIEEKRFQCFLPTKDSSTPTGIVDSGPPKRTGAAVSGIIGQTKKLAQAIQLGMDAIGSEQMKILTIKRSVRATACKTQYDIIVAGNSLGNIAIGETVETKITANTVPVEIIPVNDSFNRKLKLVLRLGNNPVITIKVDRWGAIVPTVDNAKILERKNYYDRI
jgi:tetratricopeptide (TPR) repeat protein